ncbi:sugar nucleotide-binding protein, partial [Pseudoalteromonas phenolica]|uniref:sugar nucleotide-binding protein n=1 Tax=Pseudoalteromonas phenolica TaxID=161398 RepID=UPI00110BD841
YLDKVYHYSDLGVTSWYDFAVAIQDIAFENGLLNKKIPIQPIPASAYPTPAKRPLFSLMYKKVSPTHANHWRVSLSEMLLKIH